MFQYKIAPNIHTDRLLIKMVSVDDAKDFYEFCSDKNVCEYLTFNPYKSVNYTKIIINNMINAYIHGTDVNFSVFLKSNYKVIGSISLSFKNEGNFAEIGYLFNSSYWGNGYATESLKAIIKIAFEYYSVDFIIASYVKDNISSERLLLSNGFEVIETIKNGFVKNGKSFDLVKVLLPKNIL